MAKGTETLKENRDILAEMQDNMERYNQKLKEADGFTKKITKNNAKILSSLIKTRKQNQMSGKHLGKVADLAKKINAGEIDIVKSKRMIADIDAKLLKFTGKKHKGLRQSLKAQKGMLVTNQSGLKSQARSNELMGVADKLTGGMAGKAKGFLKNARKMGPAMLAVGLAVGLVAGTFKLLMKSLKFVSKMTDALGKSFGVVGSRSKEFRDNMQEASVDVISLGKGTADVIALTGNLADNFGISFMRASTLNDKILDSGVAMGLSTQEAGNLFGILMSIGQLTADQAEHLAESTYQLAVANDVNPATVMRDMADSAEMIAKFGAQNVKELTKAAIQARKLGLTLKTVDKISDSMLNFQSSIQAEMEASVVIGRQLNFQEARRLFNMGKTSKAMGIVLKQLGGEQKFNKLSIIQRKILAKSIGVEATELAKLVRNQGKSIQAQKTFNDLLGEDGMSALTSLINKIKEIGSNLLLNLGGPLEKLLERVEDVLLDPKTMETLNSMFDSMGARLEKALEVMDTEYLEEKLKPFKDALVGADGNGGIAASLSTIAESAMGVLTAFSAIGRMLSGAVAGAAIGAFFGPPGIGIGALIGGLLGLATPPSQDPTSGGSGLSIKDNATVVNDFRSGGSGSHLILTPKGQLLKTNPRDTVFGTTSVNDFTSAPMGAMGRAGAESSRFMATLVEQNETMINEVRKTTRAIEGLAV